MAGGGRDGTLRLWDVPAGKEVTRSQGGAGVLALAFSPDGKTLATGSGDQAQMAELVQVQRETLQQGVPMVLRRGGRR